MSRPVSPDEVTPTYSRHGAFQHPRDPLPPTTGDDVGGGLLHDPAVGPTTTRSSSDGRRPTRGPRRRDPSGVHHDALPDDLRADTPPCPSTTSRRVRSTSRRSAGPMPTTSSSAPARRRSPHSSRQHGPTSPQSSIASPGTPSRSPTRTSAICPPTGTSRMQLCGWPRPNSPGSETVSNPSVRHGAAKPSPFSTDSTPTSCTAE